jgi:hypothetical protein
MLAEAVGLAALAISLGLQAVASMWLTITGDVEGRHLTTAPLALLWGWAAWVRHRRVKCEVDRLSEIDGETLT